METVTVSPKYQVVIPLSIRRELKIKPGEKVVMIKTAGHVHLIPVGDIKKARGMAKGVTSEGMREKHERFD